VVCPPGEGGHHATTTNEEEGERRGLAGAWRPRRRCEDEDAGIHGRRCRSHGADGAQRRLFTLRAAGDVRRSGVRDMHDGMMAGGTVNQSCRTHPHPCRRVFMALFSPTQGSLSPSLHSA
jgi:hypothetical protein